MKKVTKSFIAMVLGLSLVLAGCSKDEDEVIEDFSGNYDVTIIVKNPPAEALNISTALKLSKEGKDYVASAEFSTSQPPVTGSLSLKLTSVKEIANAGGVASYGFNVTSQTFTINGDDLFLSGTGTLGSVVAAGYTIEMDLATSGKTVTVTINGKK
ncbi:MAG: hypothetical protein LBT49_01040 [Prevotellaceae bacterium]|jgi:hypothetical protein|nr:hypothetical protein [Prevotellaceae bacterium]